MTDNYRINYEFNIIIRRQGQYMNESIFREKTHQLKVFLLGLYGKPPWSDFNTIRYATLRQHERHAFCV